MLPCLDSQVSREITRVAISVMGVSDFASRDSHVTKDASTAPTCTYMTHIVAGTLEYCRLASDLCPIDCSLSLILEDKDVDSKTNAKTTTITASDPKYTLSPSSLEVAFAKQFDKKMPLTEFGGRIEEKEGVSAIEQAMTVFNNWSKLQTGPSPIGVRNRLIFITPKDNNHNVAELVQEAIKSRFLQDRNFQLEIIEICPGPSLKTGSKEIRLISSEKDSGVLSIKTFTRSPQDVPESLAKMAEAHLHLKTLRILNIPTVRTRRNKGPTLKTSQVEHLLFRYPHHKPHPLQASTRPNMDQGNLTLSWSSNMATGSVSRRLTSTGFSRVSCTRSWSKGSCALLDKIQTLTKPIMLQPRAQHTATHMLATYPMYNQIPSHVTYLHPLRPRNWQINKRLWPSISSRAAGQAKRHEKRPKSLEREAYIIQSIVQSCRLVPNTNPNPNASGVVRYKIKALECTPNPSRNVPGYEEIKEDLGNIRYDKELMNRMTYQGSQEKWNQIDNPKLRHLLQRIIEEMRLHVEFPRHRIRDLIATLRYLSEPKKMIELVPSSPSEPSGDNSNNLSASGTSGPSIPGIGTQERSMASKVYAIEKARDYLDVLADLIANLAKTGKGGIQGFGTQASGTQTSGTQTTGTQDSKFPYSSTPQHLAAIILRGQALRMRRLAQKLLKPKDVRDTTISTLSTKDLLSPPEEKVEAEAWRKLEALGKRPGTSAAIR
ncbi:hypothetical protein AAMO2058_000407300 [Amorphochlora amoebiformis]